MEAFKHVSNTWIVAQIIYPFIFLFSFMSFAGSLLDVSFVLVIFVFAFLFSIPGYLLCLLSFNLISRCRLSNRQKLFLWLMAITACVSLGVFIICLVFFDTPFFHDLEPFVGFGIVAAILAACIRFKQFNSTITYLNSERNLKIRHEELTTL